MTTKRRITLEITTDEAAEYAGVLVAVMNGLTCSGDRRGFPGATGGAMTAG